MSIISANNTSYCCRPIDVRMFICSHLTLSTRSRTREGVLSKGDEEIFLFFEAMVSGASASRFSAGISVSSPCLPSAAAASKMAPGTFSAERTHTLLVSNFPTCAPPASAVGWRQRYQYPMERSGVADCRCNTRKLAKLVFVAIACSFPIGCGAFPTLQQKLQLTHQVRRSNSIRARSRPVQSRIAATAAGRTHGSAAKKKKERELRQLTWVEVEGLINREVAEVGESV